MRPPKLVVAGLASCCCDGEVEVDPDCEIEGSAQVWMEKADRVNDKDLGRRYGLRSTQLPCSPIEATEGTRLPLSKRIEHLFA